MSNKTSYKFYSIMIGDKFLNSNIMRGNTSKIADAIRFEYKQGAMCHVKILRKKMRPRVVEVTCEVKEVDSDEQ